MKSGVKVLFWPESGCCDKQNNAVFSVSIYIRFPKLFVSVQQIAYCWKTSKNWK